MPGPLAPRVLWLSMMQGQGSRAPTGRFPPKEVTLIAGAPRLQQALVAGEAEYGLTGGPPVSAATLSGAATPIIAEMVALPIW